MIFSLKYDQNIRLSQSLLKWRRRKPDGEDEEKFFNEWNDACESNQ